MVLTIIVAIILVGAIFGIYNYTKDHKAVVSQEDTEESESFPVETTVEVTEKAETGESQEEMEVRLKGLKNPDSEKPFAKISTPEVSETPTEEAPKAKKKRPYKKRSKKSE